MPDYYLYCGGLTHWCRSLTWHPALLRTMYSMHSRNVRGKVHVCVCVFKGVRLLGAMKGGEEGKEERRLRLQVAVDLIQTSNLGTFLTVKTLTKCLLWDG